MHKLQRLLSTCGRISECTLLLCAMWKMGGQRVTLTQLQSTPVVVLVGTAFKEAAQCGPWTSARRAQLKDTSETVK